MARGFRPARPGKGRSKKLIGAGGDWLLQVALARRYGYRGPFDQALIDDLDNPYRAALLIESLSEPGLDEQRLESQLKYVKSLLNVHGVAICRAMGQDWKKIFSDDAPRKTERGRDVKHMFTMPDGTIVKVMGNA